MAVAAPPVRKLTFEQFLEQTNGRGKYEYVNGEAREAPTNWEHDEIGINLILMLGPYAKGKGSMSSGQAGFWSVGGNMRVPDVSFTRKERVPGGKTPRAFGQASPDFCVEIISPSEERWEMQRKVEEYFASGAQIVWHVFPETQTVTVFTSPTETQEFSAGDTLELTDLLPGFSCPVSELFSWE